MAAYIASGRMVPDAQFSCPSNTSGPEYATIPWSNLSVSTANPGKEFGDLGLCGIKGPHPRMAYCCAHTFGGPPGGYDNARVVLAAADSCTQYCSIGIVSLDLWLYCLTAEGDNVSNAFCISPNQQYYTTSGSAPRSEPYNPHADIIKDYKKMTNDAGSGRISSRWAWLLFAALHCATVLAF